MEKYISHTVYNIIHMMFQICSLVLSEKSIKHIWKHGMYFHISSQDFYTVVLLSNAKKMYPTLSVTFLCKIPIWDPGSQTATPIPCPLRGTGARGISDDLALGAARPDSLGNTNNNIFVQLCPNNSSMYFTFYLFIIFKPRSFVPSLFF